MSLALPLFQSRATAPALGAIGLIWGSMAAMVPRLKADMGLGDAELGLYLFIAAVGAIAAMAVAPWFNDRAPRIALPASTIAAALAIGGLGFSIGPVWIFAIALVLVGMTSGLLDIIANARIAQNEARFDTGLMNLNHAIYSLSYAAMAVTTGFARDAGVSTHVWFGVVAVLVLLLLPLSMMDAPSDAETNAAKVTRGPIPAVAIFAGIIAMLGFFAENATEHWSALHIERTLGQGAALGALGPAMLGLTMGIGRMAGHFFTTRGEETRLLRAAVTMASLGLLIAAIAPIPPVAYLGFALMGLGISVVVPLVLAVVGQAVKGPGRARAVARATMISYGGFFFGPPVMGLLAELGGLRVAFAIVAILLFAVSMVLIPKLRVR